MHVNFFRNNTTQVSDALSGDTLKVIIESGETVFVYLVILRQGGRWGAPIAETNYLTTPKHKLPRFPLFVFSENLSGLVTKRVILVCDKD